MKIHSPNNIEVLLHYHTTPEPHPRIDAPAVKEATEMLLRVECIKPSMPGRFNTTPKGKAWVEALCNVELPQEAYVDSNQNVLLILPHKLS